MARKDLWESAYKEARGVTSYKTNKDEWEKAYKEVRTETAKTSAKQAPTKTSTPNFRQLDQQTIKEAELIDPFRPGLRKDAPAPVKAMYDLATPVRNLMDGNVGRLAEKTADTLLMTDRSKFGHQYTPGSSPGAEKAIDFGGAVLGSLPAYGKLYKTLDTATALVPAAQKLNPLTKVGVKGAIAGGAYEGAVGFAHEETPQQLALRAGLGVGLGALGDVALVKALPAIGRGVSALKKTDSPMIEGLDLRPGAKSPLIPEVPTQLQAPTGRVTEALPEIQAEVPENALPTSRVGINETSPQGTVRDNINRGPQEKQSFSDKLKTLYTEFIDDLAPLARAEKEIRGKISSAEDSLYKMGRLSRGAPEKAHDIIRTRLAPSIKEIEGKGYTYQDLGDYAVAVHAKDVNAQGLNSGFTNEQITNTLARLGTPEMEAARKELIALSNDLLNELVDAQIITKESAQAMRQKWPNYMPLFRHFDDDKVEFNFGMSKAMANVADPIKQLKGSQRKVVDPIESMVKNVFKSVSAAERNKVALQLGKLADEDTKGIVRRLAQGEEVGRKNVVYARENGERVGYEVHPELYTSMLNLDKISNRVIIRAMQKPASVLRAGATLTPEFSLRNPMRDIVQAYVVSNSGFNPVVDFPMALLDVVSRGKIPEKLGWKSYYSQWLQDGGGYGNIVSMDRKVHQDAIKRIVRQKPTERFKNILTGKSAIELLRSIADASESATKLGEYRAALRSGTSRKEAAYRSRDIMDFARSGLSVREVNRMVAFLNANIQGKDRIIRAIKNDPVGVTIRATKLITLPTIGAFIAQKYLSNDKQKELIDDAPKWLKNTFWLVPIPGTDTVARIPKPFDLSPIFANAPERFMEYVYNKDKNAFDGFAKESLGELALPVMLTGFVPFVEGAFNYSWFRQAPIIPERERNIDYPDQHDIHTTETAKAIAKGVHKITDGEGPFKNFGSPRIIDNTIKGLTAGLGQYATGAIDLVLEGLDVSDKPTKPHKKISEKPLIRAFTVNPNISGESMEKLYTEREKLTKRKGSAQAKEQEFRQEDRLKEINTVTKEIGDISKEIRRIENDPLMSAKAKRARIDSLSQERNKIAREAAKYFKL